MPRILVTRSPHQASELAQALRELGADPILIPTIELVEPTSYGPLDAAIAHLETFHWLLFTSANAVEAFHRRLETGPAIPWPRPSIAAIGSATARALEAIGLTPTLIPEKAIAESFADALLPHARPGVRFLLLRAEQARDHLPEALRTAGAEVVIAPVYRTVTPAGSVEALRQLFVDPANYPDAITFTSSSTATNLLELLAVAGLTLPKKILRISIGPVTSATLCAAGYPPHAEADVPTVVALAATAVKGLALDSSCKLL